MSLTVHLFTPNKGSVYNLFAGLMTLALAAARNGKKCMSIKTNKVCSSTSNAIIEKCIEFIEKSKKESCVSRGF